jgi:hypothetical protein
MNEVEYMLRQDAREKKAAGRGIYHKRSGSKTKYVGLPSDHLTAAQMKRRNGPVSTFNINKRLTYAEFKELPADLASEYLTRLHSTYNVRLENMAESMGTTKSTIVAYLRKYNISHPCKRSGPRKIDPRWGGFITGKYTSTGARIPAPEEVSIATAEKPKPAPIIPEPIKPTPEPTPKTKLVDIDLGGSGTPEAILDMLMTAFASLTTSSQTYEFAIHLHAEGGED